MGDRELVVELGLDRDRYIYVLYVRSGWPPEFAKPRRSLSLSEVYAITLIGKVREFSSPELARLKTKALLEAGLIERPEIRLAELPGAPRSPRRTVDSGRGLSQTPPLRVGGVSREPFAFSAPWVASLNGTSEQTIRAGKAWLKGRGFL